MGGFLVFIVAAIGLITAGVKVPEKAQHSAEHKCHCSCDYIAGEFPWALDDVQPALKPGEVIVKRIPFFRAGPLVCLPPNEPMPRQRFIELQAIADAGYRARVCERDPTRCAP